jgi:hypothetical protein
MHRRSLLIGGGAAAIVVGATGIGWMRAVGSSSDYDATARTLRAGLSTRPELKDAIRLACLAANGHNTQPWRFRVTDVDVGISPDLSRRTPVVDPDDHHLYVSLGCAAENLAIAASSAGWPGELLFEDGAMRFVFTAGASRTDPLLAAIPKRQSTRADFDGRNVAPADLAQLENAATEPGVRMILVTDRAEIGRIRDLVLAGNDVQMHDAAFLAELKHWLRFNPRAAMAGGDGLYAAASGNPVLLDWLGPHLFDLFVTAKSERDRYAKQMDSSAGLAVFVGDDADPLHWMKVGRACQRFALTATSLGLKHAFVNQPVEVASFRPALATQVGEPGKRPDLVMRFGYGPTLPYSLRRSVDDVLA